MEFLYWAAAMVAVVVGIFLLAIKYDKPLNQRSYMFIRTLLAVGTFLDGAICFAAGIFVKQGLDPTILNHHIVPLIFNIQLSLMAYAMMGMLHMRHIDRFSPWVYNISAAVAAVTILTSYMIWCNGNHSWESYADFVLGSRFIRYFRLFYITYLMLALVRTSVHLIRASRLYVRTVENYFTEQEVISGRRLAASVYVFLGYFLCSALTFIVSHPYVSQLAELTIICFLILFAIMIINLHNIYFRVYPPHNMAEMLRSIEERKHTVVPLIPQPETVENTVEIESPKNLPSGSIEEIIVKWSLRSDKPFVHESLTLLDVAEQTQLSPRLLSEFLNKYYKINFCTWINTLRVDEVKRLLSEQPKLSLTEISTMVGFSDPTSLSKIFKKISQESPSAYKKRISA